MIRSWMFPAVAALALAVASCSESTAPEAALDQQVADVVFDVYAPTDADGAQHAHTLGELLREALLTLDRAEVREALADIRAIRREALALRRAGDREAAWAKLAEARLEIASLILRVLGTEPVEALIADVGMKLETLAGAIEQLQAAGIDVTRLVRVHDFAAARYEEALALDLSDPVQAAHALDRIARAYEALTTGPHAPPGMGWGRFVWRFRGPGIGIGPVIRPAPDTTDA